MNSLMDLVKFLAEEHLGIHQRFNHIEQRLEHTEKENEHQRIETRAPITLSFT